MIQSGCVPELENWSGTSTVVPLGSYEDSYWSDDEEYRLGLHRFIETARVHIGEFVRLAIVHGSQADATYVRGWSDIDTLVVLKDEVVIDPVALITVRQGVFSLWPFVEFMCPLQHHGLGFVTEGDLSRYLTAFMPMEAFQGARRFLGSEGCVRIRTIPRSSGAVRSLQGRLECMDSAMKDGIYRHHPKGGKYFSIDWSDKSDNMFQLFAYLNYQMLVPSLYFDARGTPVYKGESFFKANRVFSPESLVYLELLSAIRKEWEEREYGRYKGIKAVRLHRC